MTFDSWMDWSKKQLSDMSERLLRQGYYPARIEYLQTAAPAFHERFQGFLNRISDIMDRMAENPMGYHHFEAFTTAKSEFLHYTNRHRANFLDLAVDYHEFELAQTA